MHPNDLPLHHPLFTSLTDLERCLDPSAAQTFRQLSDVLLFPADIPRLPTVLTVVCNSISAYGATLQAPNLLFRHIKDVVDGLRDVVLDKLGWTTSSHELAHPLLKRLLPHAPYALCLSAGMVPAEEATRYWIAIGVEIASCLATGKIFARSFSNDLRRDITPQLFRGKGPIDSPVPWADTAARKIRLAAKLFEADGPSEPSDTQGTRLFDLKSGFELSRKLRYAPPRQRQAILDRHHQTGWQLRASAAQLFARAEAGDQTALLTVIAFVAGLSLATTKDMPIDSTLAGDKSVMALNLNDGTILTNLGRLTPSAAKPSTNTTIFRPASWISVKPLPAILVELLRRIARKCPGVATLGELLPMAATSGHQPTLTDDQSALRPTTARFLASACPVAVALGIDRLSAALLTNDFSVIPGSKLYYSLAAREPIWDAANRLFGAMGWGLGTGDPTGTGTSGRLSHRAKAQISQDMADMDDGGSSTNLPRTELRLISPFGTPQRLRALLRVADGVARCCERSQRVPFHDYQLKPDRLFCQRKRQTGWIIPRRTVDSTVFRAPAANFAVVDPLSCL